MNLQKPHNTSDLWSIVWQTFENASSTYDLASLQTGNATKINLLGDTEVYENPTTLAIVAGLALAWIAGIHITPAKLDWSIEIIIRGLVSIVLNISCFILFSPIAALILVCFFAYRQLIHLVLKISLGKEYAGLLEGLDCVWAIEDSSALSVINILGILEITDENLTSTINKENILQEFCYLVESRLISSELDKLCWLKEKKYGYYYWRRSDCVKLEERVRWLDNNNDDNVNDDDDGDKEAGTCYEMSEEYLKKMIAKMCNKPLPQNHTACWEILITKKCKKSSIHNCTLKKEILLLFRVHHALGDGVALLRLLLEVVADSKNADNCQEEHHVSQLNNQKIFKKQENENMNCKMNSKYVQLPLLRKSSSLYGNYYETSDIIYYSKDILGISMPFSKIIWIQTAFKTLKTNIREFGKKIAAFILIPTCLVCQALRSMDSSDLHRPTLTGDKIISYWMENDHKNGDDYSLLKKIRDIKNATGTRFSDVILTALSANLNNYFLQNEMVPPTTLTVVIPVRMTLPRQKLSLRNGFSIGILPLCISNVNSPYDNHLSDDSSNMFERLRNVSASNDKLHNNFDFIVNYWVMKWFCSALPEYFLRPLVHSNSTMVLSNLPGPQTVSILGHPLRKISFWIPHRGTTGIGFSFLSYNGNVNLSIIVDKAIINESNTLNEILKGTVRNIEQLHDKITHPCFEI